MLFSKVTDKSSVILSVRRWLFWPKAHKWFSRSLYRCLGLLGWCCPLMKRPGAIYHQDATWYTFRCISVPFYLTCKVTLLFYSQYRYAKRCATHIYASWAGERMRAGNVSRVRKCFLGVGGKLFQCEAWPERLVPRVSKRRCVRHLHP